jgi:ribosome maturation factor RimP
MVMTRIEETVLAKTEALAEKILADEGLELVEVQYRREGRGWVLRLFIDRPVSPNDSSGPRPSGSGVTLEDCTWVSRELGRLLDVEEVIPGRYTLEISSPGLNRPLKKPSDFERFAGRMVKVKSVGQEGRRSYKGRLLGLENGNILLDINGKNVEVPFDRTEHVRLVPEVDWTKGP